MDEDGLPIVGSGIDLTKVPAIEQKRTVAFLNQFVLHTAQFLNRFSAICEEKLSALSLRVQQIETTLNILDAKLSSIPGLEDVKVETQYVSPNSLTNGHLPPQADSQSLSVSPQSDGTQNSVKEIPSQKDVQTENVITVAKDPRYARYLKMVQVGVPVMAIRNKMISEGLNPDYLDGCTAPEQLHLTGKIFTICLYIVLAKSLTHMSRFLIKRIERTPDAAIPEGAPAAEESSDSESSFSD